MNIVYDTETTGLPLWKDPSVDPRQPHLVQLAALLCDDTGSELETIDVIIKPDGWTIPDEVAEIHGITTERASDEGIPEADAVAMFTILFGRAALRIAHNEPFDRRIMRIAMLRSGIAREDIETMEARPYKCTQVLSKPVLKLPPTDKMMAAGFKTFKTPNLAECIKHFFDEELPGAHSAMIDCRACARVYFHLQQLTVAA